MKKIRWGIIGCGDVTEIKSGPGFQKASGSELIAVMRRNGELAKDYANRHSVPRWYNNAEKLINDPDVDAIYIATPPSSHKRYVIDAAGAGKPVYVEKPMALNYAECVEMVEVCEKAGVPLFVAYYRRALPRFIKIKAMIDDGQIGKVQFVNTRLHQIPSENDKNGITNWRVDPSTAGCGYFCDLGSHIIDLMQFYLGNIISAEGFTTNIGGYYKAEDSVSAIFNFDNGILGTGSWFFCDNENIDQTEIIGSEGKIVYSSFSDSSVKLIKEDKIEEIYIKHPEHVAQPLIQSIVDELLGIGKSPSTGKTGAAASWAMDKILGRL
jgi:predicted dehydrogenase